MSDTEAKTFLRSAARDLYWHRADRRTREGRAQLIALARGWIEPAPPGTGYRIVDPAILGRPASTNGCEPERLGQVYYYHSAANLIGDLQDTRRESLQNLESINAYKKFN